MSEQFELAAELRSDAGKGASRRLRRLSDKVPAILYGGDTQPQNIMLEHRHVLKALQNQAFFSHILTLKVDGSTHKAVLKDVQRHPYKTRVMHMDFLRITGKEKLHMNIPVHFINEATAPGVQDGGAVFHHVHHIEVICSPADLPEFIEIDLGKLGLDTLLHLSEVKLPQGVTSVALQHGEDPSVAVIHLPRAVEEEEAPVLEEEAAAAEEGAAPEAEAAPSETPATPPKE